MPKYPLILFSFVMLLVSCGGKNAVTSPVTRQFPSVAIPVMIESENDRAAYLARDFWTPFFQETFPTDSAHILGVPDLEFEQALSNYISLLERIPMNNAQKSVESLFEKAEAKQSEDTTSLFFLRFTEIVSKYLYDPNSPLRSEDLYLPFVKGLAASPFTREDMRVAYVHEAQMCSLNPFGSKAPDFKYTDSDGRCHHLYDIRAGLTLLFFSNPGCSACKTIMDELKGAPELEKWISEGRLAIASIYIDRDLEAWREHVPDYPRSWIVGYDCEYIIREDLLYNVRAIPSLYLLDSEKRVILKDAPTDKALRQIFLRIQNQ